MFIDPDAEFEWDENKRLANIRKHGVDFIAAKRIFGEGFIEARPVRRGAEERWEAFGTTKQGQTLLVVFAWRRGKRRLISARPASRGERAALAAASES